MKRRDEVLVGVFAVIAIIVGIVGTLWLARRGFGNSYPVYTYFEWGAGLKPGQQVLLAGVQVGYVDAVDITRDGRLFVRMSIDDDRVVPEGTVAEVQTLTIFGDRAVALRPQLGFGRGVVEPSDTIPAAPAAASIDALVARADTVTGALTDVAETFQVQFVRDGGLADLRATIAQTNRLVTQLNTIAAEQSRVLNATLLNLRNATAAIDSSTINATLNNVQATTQNLQELTQNLEQFTAKLDTVALGLQQGRGTAGRLLSDESLYNDLRVTVTRLDSLIADVKANPGRYINVRVF